MHDPLTSAKINVALSVAKEVAPFLTKYQCNKPVVAFLSSDLFIFSVKLEIEKIDIPAMSNMQSIFYLDTCRPGARTLVQNTNVGYKILHGKIYISRYVNNIKKFSYNYKSKNCVYIMNI